MREPTHFKLITDNDSNATFTWRKFLFNICVWSWTRNSHSALTESSIENETQKFCKQILNSWSVVFLFIFYFNNIFSLQIQFDGSAHPTAFLLCGNQLKTTSCAHVHMYYQNIFFLYSPFMLSLFNRWWRAHPLELKAKRNIILCTSSGCHHSNN